jgi:hypothetical protein
MKNTNMNAMNTAINTILENIGNNPEAMKALIAALTETGKIANEAKTEQAKKACRYVICLERWTVNAQKVYHPFVMTPPTCENPVMLIADNAVKAQDMAQTYGMRIRDNVYAMPATEEQIEKLTELLKECNKRIVDAIDAAVEAVGMVSRNIDKDVLCAQYMRQMMDNCHGVIGSSMTKDSEIIEEDVEVLHPDRSEEDDCDDEYDEDDCDEDGCEWCDCDCCPNHPDNQ